MSEERRIVHSCPKCGFSGSKKVDQLTKRAETLAYYLRIYDHAHETGNSVPGNIVAEARLAMEGLAKP